MRIFEPQSGAQAREQRPRRLLHLYLANRASASVLRAANDGFKFNERLMRRVSLGSRQGNSRLARSFFFGLERRLLKGWHYPDPCASRTRPDHVFNDKIVRDVIEVVAWLSGESLPTKIQSGDVTSIFNAELRLAEGWQGELKALLWRALAVRV